jgi:hypothetical protein
VETSVTGVVLTTSKSFSVSGGDEGNFKNLLSRYMLVYPRNVLAELDLGFQDEIDA